MRVSSLPLHAILVWWSVQSSNSFTEQCFPKGQRSSSSSLQGSSSQHWDIDYKLFSKSTILRYCLTLPLFSMPAGVSYKCLHWHRIMWAWILLIFLLRHTNICIECYWNCCCRIMVIPVQGQGYKSDVS